MANVFELAKQGLLAEADLKGPSLCDLHKFNGATNLTPLGVAVWEGHFRVAKLLLDYKADPNGCRRGRPPLWVATSKTRGSVAEDLIQLLLDHNADACLASAVPLDGGTTPLYNAVMKRMSCGAIKRLVDAGADPRAVVTELRKSAWELARERRDTDRLSAMRPRAERALDTLRQTTLLMGIVTVIACWMNKCRCVLVTAAIVVGAALLAKDAMYGRLTSWLDDRFGKYICCRRSIPGDDTEAKAVFAVKLHQVIVKYNLVHFFRWDDPFLKKVVDKAVDLDLNPNNKLDPHDLAHLALYRPVFYCDDSDSMKEPTTEGAHRIDDQRVLVQHIAAILRRVIPVGEEVGLHFINSDENYNLLRLSSEEINNRMASVKPLHATPIGTKLTEKVLENAVYRPLAKGTFKRPVLVFIITDGDLSSKTNEQEIQKLIEAIQKCGQALERNQLSRKDVLFQISQIGVASGAAGFLTRLQGANLSDVVYVTTERLDNKFAEFRRNKDNLEQWLLELLMRPILNQPAEPQVD